jgi:hypothetical protein
MGTAIKETTVSDSPQSQMMSNCAFCGESTNAPPVGGVLTVRSQDGRMGAFAVHTHCAVERMHPRAQALLSAAPVIPTPE